MDSLMVVLDEIGDIVVIGDGQLGGSGAPDLEIEITAVSPAEYPGVFDGTEVNKNDACYFT